MRGKQFGVIEQLSPVRITPAYAGKTVNQRKRLNMEKDHPRVCGENGRRTKKKGALRGSPPRMRGKQNGKAKDRDRLRITPAYAGKTVLLFLSIRSIQDHPRVCGENQALRRPKSVAPGSPPRMRGKLRDKNACIDLKGITPAYAGKTCRGRRRRRTK